MSAGELRQLRTLLAAIAGHAGEALPLAVDLLLMKDMSEPMATLGPVLAALRAVQMDADEALALLADAPPDPAPPR